VKLPAGFDPMAAARAAGARRQGWLKLGDGMWTGDIWRAGGAGNGNGDPDLVVEELPTSWKVTDVYAGRELKGRDLEALLRKALTQKETT